LAGAADLYPVIGSATAILDRFLHHSALVQITGRSYRLASRGKNPEISSKVTKAPTGSAAEGKAGE
jgi:hypothetical protein